MFQSCIACSLTAVLSASALGMVAADADEPSLVSLRIRSQVVAPDALVRVAHVARVLGGNHAAREAIGFVDLTELPRPVDVERLSKRQVEMRLLLAGVPRDSFRILGADSVEVRRQPPSGDSIPHVSDEPPEPPSINMVVLRSVRRQLAEYLAVDPSEMKVRLLRPLSSLPEELLEQPDRFEYDAMLPERLRLGTMGMRVRVLKDGILLRTLPVTLDVRVMRDVVVTSKVIAAGQVVTAEQVSIARRAIADVPLAAAGEIIGNHARISMQPGHAIRPRDMRARQAAPFAVRSGDIVRMIAHDKTLHVSAAGQVLQQGRIGDSVRVRNVSSRKVLVGKVKSQSEVEITF